MTTLKSKLARLLLRAARYLDPEISKPTRYRVDRFLMIDTSYRLTETLMIEGAGRLSHVQANYEVTELPHRPR